MTRVEERTARGGVARATLDFVRTELGEDQVTAILDGLSPDTAEQLRDAGPSDEIAMERLFDLWRAVDRRLGPEDPEWAERAGAFSIESAGTQQYGGIVGKPSPLEFLTQRVSLFRLFYRSGRMEVVWHDEGKALLRLVDFGDSDPLFCRRQTGGLARALILARGGEPSVRHVRCVHEGDAFCEWSLGWEG
ncbi:MAG: hypothetical protein EA351_03600 [Gemmatimonadales bacterium]|nr:MAG: hypothetical protein EA351_03600 [Gemmatimonadales bacterium]